MKIPAHKELLAVSSPVFNAMFNGELKEKSDVKIVDASYEAFKEFLQFFYENKVKLTMGNIVEVLNLVNKYDIAVGSKIVTHFLMENLTSDQILWGLHLAVKYQHKNLKTIVRRKWPMMRPMCWTFWNSNLMVAKKTKRHFPQRINCSQIATWQLFYQKFWWLPRTLHRIILCDVSFLIPLLILILVFYHNLSIKQFMFWEDFFKHNS